MDFKKIFYFYLSLAKKLAQTLPDNARTKACQWVTKLETFPVSEEDDKKIRLHALKLLLLSLSRKQLVGAFENSPDDHVFQKYNWNSHQLNDFVNMINEKEQAASRNSKISYATDGNRRKLVTYQVDPQTGQHCYYSCSREPVERWDNLQGGAIPSEKIDTWQERGGWEELNGGGSQISSIDPPRCQPQSDTRNLDFVIHDERRQDSNVHPTTENKADKSLHARPRTPAKLGGSSQTQRYTPEQFGLSREEHFRSPRLVFQHSQYDQYPFLQKISTPSHLIEQADGTITSGRHLKKLIARLDELRNANYKPLQDNFVEPDDLEPNKVEYERIGLNGFSFNELSDANTDEEDKEDEESLGILSSDEMYNEDLFGEVEVPDDKSKLKENNGIVTSHSVVKIETNTTICGNEGHITEKILEQKDVNVPQVALATDQSHIQSHKKLKRKPDDISRGWEDSMRRLKESADRNHQYSHPAVDVSEHRLDDVSQPQFTSTFEDSRAKSKIDQRQFHPFEVSEKLEDVRQPDFPYSQYATTLEDSTRRSEMIRSRKQQSRLPDVDNSELLTDVIKPQVSLTFKDSRDRSEANRRKIDQSQFYPTNVSERLEDISQPDLLHSFDSSIYGPQLGRRRAERSRLPNVDTSERLTEVRQPQFATTFEDSTRKSEISRSRKKQSHLPDVDNSKLLTEVSQPQFFQSFEDSRDISQANSRKIDRNQFYPMEVSEMLEDISQPGLTHSLDYSKHRSEVDKRRTERSHIPNVDLFERLTDHPQFASNLNGSRANHVSERIDDFPQSLKDYRPTSGATSRRLHRTHIPDIDFSEQLADVSQPNYPSSFQMSEYNKPGLVSIDRHTETHIKTHTSPYRQTHTKRITTQRTERISKPQYTEENLDDISLPTYHSVRHNLKESTYPSHHSTFHSPRNLQNLRLSKAPQRHRFPKHDPTAKLQSSDRTGDYRKPFVTMPHYGPFEEQINPKWSPGPTKEFITKLRRPGTFGTSTTMIPTHDRKNQTLRSRSRDRVTKPFQMTNSTYSKDQPKKSNKR